MNSPPHNRAERNGGSPEKEASDISAVFEQRGKYFLYAICLLVGGILAGYWAGRGTLTAPETEKVPETVQSNLSHGRVPHLIDPMTSVPILAMATILLLFSITGFIYVWSGTMDLVERQAEAAHKPVIAKILMSGAPIRSITVSVIVLAVGFLSFFDRLTTEAAAILSGIAGYMLGAMPKVYEESSPQSAQHTVGITANGKDDKHEPTEPLRPPHP